MLTMAYPRAWCWQVLPKIRSQKFIYADDITLAYQGKSFEEAEAILQKDLSVMTNYVKSWRLKLNLSKTEVSAFHLNNQMVSRSLNNKLNNVSLNHNFNSKMLGITLNRSLTYRAHLEQKIQKLSSRINLLQQLTGSS